MNADDRWFQGTCGSSTKPSAGSSSGPARWAGSRTSTTAGPWPSRSPSSVDGDSVLFRVAPYSGLARHLPDALVAFEVDDLDDFTRTGWSVVLRGRIQTVESDDLPAPEARPTPWPEGQRSLHLRLTP